MNKAISKDGTIIAYDVIGEGPPLILVDGALCYRESGPNGELAKHLADRFTVITYDRRGRGSSTNNMPYAVEREIEDIDALIKEAGDEVFLYGISSGAVLALEATGTGLPVKKLALYEAPLITDKSRDPVPADYLEELNQLLESGERSASVKLFMKKAVGLPAVLVFVMPLMPAWSKLKSVAHTLPYDANIVEGLVYGKQLPAGKWSNAAIPTLVMSGGKSQGWIQKSAREMAQLLPNAQHQTLEKQTHIVKPGVLAPALKSFFLT